MPLRCQDSHVTPCLLLNDDYLRLAGQAKINTACRARNGTVLISSRERAAYASAAAARHAAACHADIAFAA